MLPLKPLAARLEAKYGVDQFGDEQEIEWTLADAETKLEVAVILPLNGEGEAYAKRLMKAYNGQELLLAALRRIGQMTNEHGELLEMHREEMRAVANTALREFENFQEVQL